MEKTGRRISSDEINAGYKDSTISFDFSSEYITLEKNQETKDKSRAMPPAHNTVKLTPGDVYSIALMGEDGIADLYVSLYKDIRCYDHSSKKWYYFDEYWRLDLKNVCISEFKNIRDLFDIAVQKFAFQMQSPKAGIDEKKKIERKIKVITSSIKSINTITFQFIRWDLPVNHGIKTDTCYPLKTVSLILKTDL